MWTCPKCMTENPDRSTYCENCSAPRVSGRFNVPQIHSAEYVPQEPAHRRSSSSAARSPYSGHSRQPEAYPPKHSKACKLLRFSGFMLLFLLPLLAGLLCWKQFDVLYKTLVPLLTGSAAKNITGYLTFSFYALCALFICLVPGLSILTATCKYKPNKRTEDLSFL